MKLRSTTTALDKLKDDVIIVGTFEGQKKLGGAAADIDSATSGLISAARTDITGKLHQTCLLYATQGLAAKRVLVIGLGKEKDLTRDRVRGIAARAVSFARDAGLVTAALPLQLIPGTGLDPAQRAAALCEGALLGLYTFRQYKTAPENGDNVTIQTDNDMHRTGAVNRGCSRHPGCRNTVRGRVPGPRPGEPPRQRGNTDIPCRHGPQDCKKIRACLQRA